MTVSVTRSESSASRLEVACNDAANTTLLQPTSDELRRFDRDCQVAHQ